MKGNTMSADKAMAWFLLGVLTTAGAISTWKTLDRRLSSIERKVYTPVGITAPDDEKVKEQMREIRRESARDFAAALREEGLTVAETVTK
jgi:hypothetical protein